MKKKIVSALLCVAILSTMLAGCGESGGKSSKADGDKPYSGEKLTVLYMSGVYAEAAESMVDEFEEKTGATVEVVDFPYTTLHEKTLLDLTSGTGSYDVVDVASQWDGEFAPYLTDLSDFMDKDNYKTDEFIEKVLENSGEWQGVQTGIPNASTPQLFAYRTDLLPDGLPDTWEEYREVAKELTDKDKGMYGISVSATTGQLGGVFDYILWSMGGAWADEDWNVTIDSQETRDALNHLKEIQDYADPSILSWGTEESIKAFLDGNAAICETWPTLGLVQAADDEYYLKHNFRGEEDLFGCIFLEHDIKKNFTDSHSILYGHNIEGNMMFANLNRYEQPEFLKKCPEIEIITPKRKFLYKIFSVEQASSQSPAFEYGYKLSSLFFLP